MKTLHEQPSFEFIDEPDEPIHVEAQPMRATVTVTEAARILGIS